MKATVDPELCTGCGVCVDICSEVFEIPADLAVVKTNPVPEDSEDDCTDAAEQCPVEAIIVEE